MSLTKEIFEAYPKYINAIDLIKKHNQTLKAMEYLKELAELQILIV